MAGTAIETIVTKQHYSVAMATYNGATFLREQLLSIAAQSLPVNEIVVCDDCSTDATCEVIEAFVREHPGMIRFCRNATQIGYSQNFARAIERCRGDIIFLCDQDDIWQPTRVEQMAACYAFDKDCDVVATGAAITDNELSPPGKKLLPQLHTISDGVNTFPSRFHNFFAYGCTLAFRASLRPLLLPIPPIWDGHDTWICFLMSIFSAGEALRKTWWLCENQSRERLNHACKPCP